MIIFDQLRISDDGRLIYINLHVNRAKDFVNKTIKSLTIMTALKKGEDGKKMVNIHETYPDCPTEDYIFKMDFGEGVREVDLVLDVNAIGTAFTNWNSAGEVLDTSKPYAKMAFTKTDFSQDLFFVYVECAGAVTADSCCPCWMDKAVTVGTTFDDKLLYQKVMGYTKQLADDCTVPQGFTDFILLWNAFKAAIETEHYIPAIKYYQMLFGMGSDSFNKGYGTKGCGCNGKIGI